MRTLEDIVPPSRRRGASMLEAAQPPDRGASGGPARGRFPFITIIIAGVVIAGSVVALLHFSGAKVEIAPTTVELSVQTTLTAGSGTSDVPYKLLSVKKAASQDVAASGSKQVSTSASGAITIYNAQAKPQKLIANTRFASTAGLIFRIHSAVTVPAGSANKPGSLTATVYADAPGASYNVGPSSFSIPGLAGTAESGAVYARSAEAMTGGASGSVPVVDASAEKAAVSAMEESLAKDLDAAVAGEVPEGYVLIPGATHTAYHELEPALGAAADHASLQVEGTETAFVFPQTALASAVVAAAATSDFSGPATLGTGTALTLADISAMPAAESDSFTFSLSGTAVLVAAVNPSQIASAVAGKSRQEAQVALTNYPEVKRAFLVLRPFWKQTFPEDPAAITVVVDQPQAGGV